MPEATPSARSPRSQPVPSHLLLLAGLVAAESPPETPSPDRIAELFAKASPEHKIAMLEAPRWVPETDECVAEARTLRGKVDRLQVEDAAGITALLELIWRAIRAEAQEASTFKILEG